MQCQNYEHEVHKIVNEHLFIYNLYIIPIKTTKIMRYFQTLFYEYFL